MLYVCVRGVMHVVFYVCIVTRGTVGGRVWVFRHADVVCLCLVCIMWLFSMLYLHDLQCVNAGRSCKRRPYGRGILQSQSHDCLICSHECILLFTPSCCCECFIICNGLCACTEMLWMCVLYVSFGYKVRPITFGYVAMSSAVLFILRSRLLLYSTGSGVKRVQVVLSAFSVRLFCFVQGKNLYVGMVVCISWSHLVKPLCYGVDV